MEAEGLAPQAETLLMYYVFGIELSGPASAADTAVVAFLLQGNTLFLAEAFTGADDHLILGRFWQWTAEGDVFAGIDAPLSYSVCSGDRPGNARLRTAIIDVGLRSGTVMAPPSVVWST
jgi:uncharacterized protein